MCEADGGVGRNLPVHPPNANNSSFLPRRRQQDQATGTRQNPCSSTAEPKRRVSYNMDTFAVGMSCRESGFCVKRLKSMLNQKRLLDAVYWGAGVSNGEAVCPTLWPARSVFCLGGFPSRPVGGPLGVLGLDGVAVLLGVLQLLVKTSKPRASHSVGVRAVRLVLVAFACWLFVFVRSRNSPGHESPVMLVSYGTLRKNTQGTRTIASASGLRAAQP